MNFLDDEEREELKERHHQERDGRVRDRIKVVLLRDKGWSYKQIAEALLISDQATRNHIEDYKKTRKLKPESGGSEEKLSEEQSKLLLAHLEEHTYLYVKDILPYIRFEFKVEYTVHGFRHWLHRHGFSYKKPALVPGKANEEAQKKWIAEYEKLRSALPESETICFIDGVHPTHNVQLAYGWIRKGSRKEIPSNSGRSRLNISGALDIVSHKLFVQEDRTLNADATITFFQKIEAAYPEKDRVHVFCDNARYYKNKRVKEYVEKSKIKLHFLPSYSPNLNPIERLWKWMKERVIYNTYYEAFGGFRDAVLGFLSFVGSLSAECDFGQIFRSRVRDRFRAAKTPSPNF